LTAAHVSITGREHRDKVHEQNFAMDRLMEEEGALTVTVNVDVEESTIDDDQPEGQPEQELIENDDMMSEADGFGMVGQIVPPVNGDETAPGSNPGSPSKMHQQPVSARLLQTTHARINSARALEEARGRVRHEDDIWWEHRGHKAYQIPRGTLNKSLAHVSSKLHVPTAATIFGQRDKANMDKIRPKPLPKASQDACNPYKDVESKFLTATTKAVQTSEWRSYQESKRDEEEKLAAELAIKSAECRKVAQTSEKLLQAQDFKKTTKAKKEVDKREEGWKRVSITDHSLSNSPMRSLLNESPSSLIAKSSSPQSPEKNGLPSSPKSTSGRSVASSSASKTAQSAPASYEVWTQQMPSYKMWVPPSRPKSPTPAGFGSSTPRATTPTEARGRSSTPTHSKTARSNSLGSTSSSMSLLSTSTANDGRRSRGSSPGRGPNTPSNGAANGMSRAAAARQRVSAKNSLSTPTAVTPSAGGGGPSFIDRSSPTTTPFDKVMQQQGLPITSTRTPQGSAVKASNNPFNTPQSANSTNGSAGETSNGSSPNKKMSAVNEALMEMY
jgi:hypothetical protein